MNRKQIQIVICLLVVTIQACSSLTSTPIVTSLPSTTSPIPTNTAMPTSTPTATPTRTPRPTPTVTPLPSWVINFAEPILAAIKDHEPSFQDDFSYSFGNGWYSEEPEKSWMIEDGILFKRKPNDCSLIQNKALIHPNFVLQTEILGKHGSIVFFGTHNGFSRYSAEVQELGGHLEWNFGLMNNGYINQPFGNVPITDPSNNVARVVIINKDSQAAFYLNDMPLAYIANLTLDYPVNGVRFECGNFDNVKFWNLDRIPNLP